MADYDTSVISVSPSGLKTVGKELATLSGDVVKSLNTIHGALDGLKVSWQGKAASDADEVNEEWLRVMTELFGTKEDPHKGVLPALADGVGARAHEEGAGSSEGHGDRRLVGVGHGLGRGVLRLFVPARLFGPPPPAPPMGPRGPRRARPPAASPPPHPLPPPPTAR
ncbi:WXG100 family type VII secretion target [Streptomyces varsoviensis]|uniref:WXG100 family type VII secretion target n=1 Tax=Streptomyces varsoviensis TaxID=67373 RepID=UPI0004CC12C0|nr:WXG100 family type VII secretion target [Streptomyces varsoviensis]